MVKFDGRGEHLLEFQERMEIITTGKDDKDARDAYIAAFSAMPPNDQKRIRNRLRDDVNYITHPSGKRIP